MEIVYYKDPVGNFGDDLNEIVWPALLPPDLRDDDAPVLVGIGSLLDRARFRDRVTAGRRVTVVGSGAAYGALPEGWRDWTFLAVRGPLTAALIEQPEAAITDSAALLARLPQLVPQASRRDAILFIPHHRTLVNSRWPEAAARAGMEFVDPRWPLDRVLAAFARAKLVVTEAMHGAIVADTLRIPWVPTLISAEVSIFKWRDWAGSLGLDYRPLPLPATSWLEAYRYRRIRRLTEQGGRKTASAAFATASDAALIADFRSRFAEEPEVIDSVPAPAAAKGALRSIVSRFDGVLVARAARALRRAAQSRPYLSDDRMFGEKVDRLEGAVAKLITSVRAG